MTREHPPVVDFFWGGSALPCRIIFLVKTEKKSKKVKQDPPPRGIYIVRGTHDHNKYKFTGYRSQIVAKKSQKDNAIY